jgi:RNA polymerase sigma factor (sigma-70 family)
LQDQAEDEPLVARSRRGDLAAFNALVEAYQGRVYNLCLRMLASPEAAEDAAQDAFLSAYRNLQHFRGASFRAWLLRIATNACTDELRRRRRRPQV